MIMSSRKGQNKDTITSFRDHYTMLQMNTNLKQMCLRQEIWELNSQILHNNETEDPGDIQLQEIFNSLVILAIGDWTQL